ncbi:MAG: thiamine pyrophosphate-dependent dehydrogenase E1 component subunit alpha, partial [Cyanobacteria bacterium]|nr:thiamine pyrophosphate-dependent dehydrogenase E1 component subunit alpha [Cyanobacteriota bacterium]
MAELLQVMKDDGKTAKLPAGLTETDVKKMYEAMVSIRAYDERALKLQRSGRIGFCVTSFGEEATQIGTAAGLEPTDWVFPSYRQYGVAMYRGVPLNMLTSHLFGNEDDLVKGRQMPAHYSFSKYKFVSISSVIGTQIIQAVGCAMAAKIRKEPVVS